MRKLAYTAFPDRVVDAFDRAKAPTADAHGSIEIDNLPIDDDVKGSPRFEETGRSFKAGVLSENVLVALSTLAGEPYSIAHEAAAREQSHAAQGDRARLYGPCA